MYPICSQRVFRLMTPKRTLRRTTILAKAPVGTVSDPSAPPRGAFLPLDFSVAYSASPRPDLLRGRGEAYVTKNSRAVMKQREQAELSKRARRLPRDEDARMSRSEIDFLPVPQAEARFFNFFAKRDVDC